MKTIPDTSIEKAREIIQADRDAALKLAAYFANESAEDRIALDAIKEGLADEHVFVQAFARHREQAIALSRDEAVEQCAKVADTWRENTVHNSYANFAAERIAEEIRTLSVTYRGEANE